MALPTQIYFCKQRVETGKKVYHRMLEEIVAPIQYTLFDGSDHYFQQDVTPADKVKEVQQ